MNIEIANRMVQLRKSHNLSQEALAEKLGISRQAVSKWERAEASPDTDNLIMLARLYGVSLDELLKTEDEIPMPGAASDEPETGEREEDAENSKDDEFVRVGFQGVHVKGKDGEVHVGWDGIHVDDRKKGDNVHIDKNGVYVNGEKYEKDWFVHHAHFPMALLIVVSYIVIGCVWNAWHPGWLLFLLIPIWESFVSAVRKRRAEAFAYPVLVTLIFLCLGIFFGLWHPGWAVFITIPLYYSLVSYFRHIREENRDSRQSEKRAGGEPDEK